MDAHRVREPRPDFGRIVVGVDPAVTSGEDADETGILGAGMIGNRGYIVEDLSGQYTPQEWAIQAIKAYYKYNADRIVAEVNQGGDMVEPTIRAINPQIPYTGVRASRGKAVRAEPIAALYERGTMFHVGEFDQLEDQMCSFTVDFDRKSQGYSPDRVDALVWGATYLFPSITRPQKEPEITIPQAYSAFA